MRNGWFFVFLLLAAGLALAGTTYAQTPSPTPFVFVSSHTNIRNGLLVPTCATEMDPITASNYPFAGAECELNEGSTIPVVTWNCFNTPSAVCTPFATVPVEAGAFYGITTTHDLTLVPHLGGCIVNGQIVDCYEDYLNYVATPGPPFPPQTFIDSANIFPRLGVPSTVFGTIPNDPNFIIGLTRETPFQATLINPMTFHAKAGDTKVFTVENGLLTQFTFTGVGTTAPVTPVQGNQITYHAPETVPGQQLDNLTGCLLDQTHGDNCATAQIILEPLSVIIPPSDYTVTPFFNPDELLGGQSVQYHATVTQGGQVVNIPVTWAKTAETSGGNFVTVDPGGTVTVQPQSTFQGADFTVDIQATSTIDPKVAISAPFAIHVPTANVQMTTVPVPGPSESTSFEATPNRSFDFDANVTGPLRAENQVVKWDQNNNLNLPHPGEIKATPTLTHPNSMSYVISIPPFPGVNIETVNIIACAADQPVDVNLAGTQCAKFPLKLSAPVFPTSPQQQINSGESTPVTITGTGFGSAPTLSFVDPNITFTPSSITGPDANGVTTIVGTMTVLPIAADETTPMTITSSLPPPSTPGTQLMTVRGVTLTPSVTPNHPSLLLTQSQQFTPSLGCVTFGGQACTVPQTFTCSIVGVGVMNPSTCVYTAPSSLIHEASVSATACSTFGNKCVTFFIDLVPVTVAVTPTSASLDSAQSQAFQSTVTNSPNNNQGTIWSIGPAVGSISAAGLYTAPPVVTTLQTVTVSGCSVVDSSHCASAAVTLNPVTVAIAPGSVTLGQGQTQQFQATVTHSTNTGVVWTISPAVGSISSTGLYTAPPSVTGNQAVVVKVCSSIAPGNCASSTVNLIPPDFQLSSASNTGLSAPGFLMGFNLTVTPIGGFTGTVTLTAAVPAGIGMSSVFSPPTISGSGSSTVTFPVLTTTPAGTYPVTITATSGTLVHSVPITVTVVLPALTLTVSPPQTASAGQTVTYTYTVSWTGFFGSVNVNVTGVPPGSTVIPEPIDPFIPGTSTFAFTTPATLAPGNYNLTFTATGDGLVTVGSSSLHVSPTQSGTTALSIPAPPPPTDPPPKCKPPMPCE